MYTSLLLQRNSYDFSKQLIELWQKKGHMRLFLPHVTTLRFDAKSSKTHETGESAASNSKEKN